MSIFVGNLPFRAEREDVLQLFAPFGEVLNCSLPLERDTGRKRGFAFVEMADETIETSAFEGLQGSELMGRPLRINKAEPRGSGGPRRGGRGGNSGAAVAEIVVAMAAAMVAVKTVVAMAAEIVVAMAAGTVVAMAAEIVVAMAA